MVVLAGTFDSMDAIVLEREGGTSSIVYPSSPYIVGPRHPPSFRFTGLQRNGEPIRETLKYVSDLMLYSYSVSDLDKSDNSSETALQGPEQ